MQILKADVVLFGFYKGISLCSLIKILLLKDPVTVLSGSSVFSGRGKIDLANCVCKCDKSPLPEWGRLLDAFNFEAVSVLN